MVAILGGVSILLILILWLKVHPFIALLLASIVLGAVAGLPVSGIMNNITSGVGGTLGFVAVIIGLGAIFGAILEESGGARSLASWLVANTGDKKAHWAMLVAGFFVAIPVFFDVGFIILLPMAAALHKKTKKPLLLYALPLLAGLAITHAFIPPTPGPVAVADIIDADIGWVILFGFLIGLPVAVVAGPLFAIYISKRVQLEQRLFNEESINKEPVSPIAILLMIFLPIVLIVGQTLIADTTTFAPIMKLVGHPISALLIANLAAWYFLGLNRGMSKDQLLKVSTNSLLPTGAIILLTGAGGAFKQMLIETGAGAMIAESLNSELLSPVAFSFLVAAIVRIVQGSATVAMITAAGITAPVLGSLETTEMQKAILVISIAAGSTMMSHVNDSGFWLVRQYLGLTETQTFKTWTIMTSIIGVVGFLLAFLLWNVI